MLKFNNKVPTDIKIGNKTVEKILMRNEVVWAKITSPFYIQNTYEGQNTISIKLTKVGSVSESNYATHFLYSKDGINWNNINISTTATNIALSQGERLYLIGDKGVLNYHSAQRYAYTTIKGNQSHTLGGNLSTLLDYTDLNVSLPANAFLNLFSGDTYLTSAADLILPSTVSGGCYMNTFSGCTRLTTPPTLPATTLKPSCYQQMFSRCSSLTTPPALPATTLAPSCYDGLFNECTSLTTAPALPASTLEDSCYRSLFYKCSSLTTAPVLKATTLVEECYQFMYYGCSSLNEVTTYANNISASNCLTEWLYGVAATGTFHNLGTATYPTDSVSGIPSGWTEVKS